MKLQRSFRFIIQITIPLLFTGVLFAQEEKKVTEAPDSAFISKSDESAESRDSIVSVSDSIPDTIGTS